MGTVELYFKVTKSSIAPTITGLWTDKIDLLGLGRAHVVRASHVEFSDDIQGWVVWSADWKILPGQPPEGFRLRADALAWEVNWAHGEIRANKELI
jgi:hypothetical protein